jgi:ribosome biogenesis GTPase
VPGGGLLLDTPGMRELALWGGGGLEETFDDVESLAAGCRFGDCGHLVEPGCAVRRAAEEGSLDPVRLAAWHKLQRELRAFERRHDQRAAAEERRRWRALTRSLRDATPRGRA